MKATARYWFSIIYLLFFLFAPAFADDGQHDCNGHIAQWLNPASSEVVPVERVFDQLARSRVILLGEAHAAVAHHRWQHYMLAALHSRDANLVVGFEMLPRSAQAVLDAWTAGTLTEKEFLEQTHWHEVWGYDADLYLPLLHFVRFNRLPAIALNIDRLLVSRVGKQGWEAISESERMGLSTPAPASDDYRDSLARLYAYKWHPADTAGDNEVTEAELDEIFKSDKFANFVDAQLIWDRAMAEALANAYWSDPTTVVVGIVGRGHLEFGYGIPHQLADMGIEDVDVLLPIESTDSCEPQTKKLASAVFVVEAASIVSSPPKPQLGVLIESTESGVRIMKVYEDSVAAQSGILVGDVIKTAAGLKTTTTTSLVEIIQRQAPGTWLPLKVKRDQEYIDVLAKFPQLLPENSEAHHEDGIHGRRGR